MPIDTDGSLREFDQAEIDAMDIRTAHVRDASHGAETREIDQSTMRKQFFVAWPERFNFCALVCGDQRLYDDSGTTRLSRMVPDSKYGTHPDYEEIIATKIESIKGANGPGVDDANGTVEYPDALVEVLYTHAPFDVKNDSTTTNEYERYTYFVDANGTGESITMSGGSMLFRRPPSDPLAGTAPDGVPIPYSFNVIRAVEEFTYKWVQLPYEAFEPGSALYNRVYGTAEGVTSYLGCVNSAEFFDRPVGTVLFSAVKPTLERSHTGRGRRWSLEYKFSYAPNGWTWLYYSDPLNPNRSGWYMVSNKGFHYADGLSDGESIVAGARDLWADLWNVG